MSRRVATLAIAAKAPVASIAACGGDGVGPASLLSKAPLGGASIRFGPPPPLTASFDSGPDGAVVTWRPAPEPDSLADDSGRTMFIEEGGRWLAYRCCP